MDSSYDTDNALETVLFLENIKSEDSNNLHINEPIDKKVNNNNTIQGNY